MNPLIDSFQTALLRASFLRGPGALVAWESCRHQVDWTKPIDFDCFRLLPNVYRNLKALGVTDPLWPKFKGIIRQTWLANQYWKKQLGEIFADSIPAGVEIMLLPPTQMVTLDSVTVINRHEPIVCAVRPNQAEQTLHSLFNAGWKTSEVHLLRFFAGGFVRGAGHLLLEYPTGQQLMITWDLKWWSTEPDEKVWDRAGHLRLGGQSIRCLDDTDALSFASCQRFVDNPFKLMAMVLALGESGQQLDWQRLHRAISQHFVSEEFLALFTFLQPFFHQWGAPAEIQKWHTILPPAATQPGAIPAPWPERLVVDWQTFRKSMGRTHDSTSALIQLPGYLMGRWHLKRMRSLPAGLLRWL